MRALAAPAAPSADWLLNQCAIQPLASSAFRLSTGYDWDAVRAPEHLGLRVAHRLLANVDDEQRLGRELHSRHSVADCVRRATVRWIHLPEPGLLASPVWFAAALYDRHPEGAR
jgi:hypothetical protein